MADIIVFTPTDGKGLLAFHMASAIRTIADQSSTDDFDKTCKTIMNHEGLKLMCALAIIVSNKVLFTYWENAKIQNNDQPAFNLPHGFVREDKNLLARASLKAITKRFPKGVKIMGFDFDRTYFNTLAPEEFKPILNMRDGLGIELNDDLLGIDINIQNRKIQSKLQLGPIQNDNSFKNYLFASKAAYEHICRQIAASAAINLIGLKDFVIIQTCLEQFQTIRFLARKRVLKEPMTNQQVAELKDAITTVAKQYDTLKTLPMHPMFRGYFNMGSVPKPDEPSP